VGIYRLGPTVGKNELVITQLCRTSNIRCTVLPSGFRSDRTFGVPDRTLGVSSDTKLIHKQ
jgi:hypothetical protein